MKRYLIPFLLSLSVFIFSAGQFATGYADSDELITMGHIFGVCHPSGYPMAVIVTGLWMRLLSFLSPAHAANLLAALLHSLTVLFVYLTTFHLLKSQQILKCNHSLSHIIALISSLTLAFSALFWLYAGVIEVVSFTAFLTSAIFFSSIRWYISSSSKNNTNFWFYSTFALVGLGLSHIHTFILITPGLAILLFSKLHSGKNRHRHHLLLLIRGLFITLVAFLIPLLFLYYLNSRSPVASWYFPSSFNSLIDFVIRKDYTGLFIEENIDRSSYIDSLNSRILTSQPHYLSFLLEHFLSPFIIISLLGFFELIKKKSSLSITLLVWFLISGPVFIGVMGIPNPRVYDIDTALRIGVLQRQLIISEISLVLIFSIGLLSLTNLFLKFLNQLLTKILLVGTCAVYLTFLVMSNTSMGVQRNNQIIHQYARQMLESATENSVIICSGDTSCFALLQASLVDNIRPDVTVLTKNSHYRRWFLSQNSQFYPYLYDQNPDFFSSLISWNVSQRPTYLTLITAYYIDYIGLEGNPFYLEPHGLLFQVTTQKNQLENIPSHQPLTDTIFTSTYSPKDYFKTGLKSYFSGVYNLQGLLHSQFDNPPLAKKYLEISHQLQPQNPLPQLWLKKLVEGTLTEKLAQTYTYQNYLDQAAESIDNNDSQTAFDLARKAAYINPGNPEPHLIIAGLMLQSGYLYRAEKEARQALIFDPQNEKAKEIIRLSSK